MAMHKNSFYFWYDKELSDEGIPPPPTSPQNQVEYYPRGSARDVLRKNFRSAIENKTQRPSIIEVKPTCMDISLRKCASSSTRRKPTKREKGLSTTNKDNIKLDVASVYKMLRKSNHSEVTQNRSDTKEEFSTNNSKQNDKLLRPVKVEILQQSTDKKNKRATKFAVCLTSPNHLRKGKSEPLNLNKEKAKNKIPKKEELMSVFKRKVGKKEPNILGSFNSDLSLNGTTNIAFSQSVHSVREVKCKLFTSKQQGLQKNSFEDPLVEGALKLVQSSVNNGLSSNQNGVEKSKRATSDTKPSRSCPTVRYRVLQNSQTNNAE